MTQKLQDKGFSIEEITCVIPKLVEASLLDDLRFTDNYIHWQRGKGLGPIRIAHELQKRGIAREVIAERLDMADNAWLIEARSVWQKHFKGKLPTDFKSRAQHMRFLYYRGFTREHIESILNTDLSGDNHDKEQDIFK